MITLPISEEVIIEATMYVDSRKIGKRKSFNGNRTNQVVGIVGEFIISDLLGIDRPNSTGFDGGWDITISEKKIDVKTVGRTVEPKLHYHSNVIDAQMHFSATHFLFCSLNKPKRTFTICGYISKEDFKKKAAYYKKGETMTRPNGEILTLNAAGYFIENRNLIQIDSIADLKEVVIFG